MSDVVSEAPARGEDAPVLARLSTLDRFLPVWILAAMAAGLLLGRAVEGLDEALDAGRIGSVCIAMVLIWNDLSCGDREAAAVLVAINSVFQIVAFAALGWFYLQALPGWLGLEQTGLDVSVRDIAASVLVFLGVPLVAGFLTRTVGERRLGRDGYETRVLPRIGPFALYGLLFTIVMLFALQGDTITSRPGDVALIAVPLLVYFAVMWAGSLALGRAIGLGYPRAATLAFTAAGNNFELAIAVAIGVFGVTSGQALAGVVGPLIEVPVLVGLVYVSLWARRFFPDSSAPSAGKALP